MCGQLEREEEAVLKCSLFQLYSCNHTTQQPRLQRRIECSRFRRYRFSFVLSTERGWCLHSRSTTFGVGCACLCVTKENVVVHPCAFNRLSGKGTSEHLECRSWILNVRTENDFSYKRTAFSTQQWFGSTTTSSEPFLPSLLNCWHQVPLAFQKPPFSVG